MSRQFRICRFVGHCSRAVPVRNSIAHCSQAVAQMQVLRTRQRSLLYRRPRSVRPPCSRPIEISRHGSRYMGHSVPKPGSIPDDIDSPRSLLVSGSPMPSKIAHLDQTYSNGPEKPPPKSNCVSTTPCRLALAAVVRLTESESRTAPASSP